jgi:hypothetical protein
MLFFLICYSLVSDAETNFFLPGWHLLLYFGSVVKPHVLTTCICLIYRYTEKQIVRVTKRSSSSDSRLVSSQNAPPHSTCTQATSIRTLWLVKQSSSFVTSHHDSRWPRGLLWRTLVRWVGSRGEGLAPSVFKILPCVLVTIDKFCMLQYQIWNNSYVHFCWSFLFVDSEARSSGNSCFHWATCPPPSDSRWL